MRPAPRRGGRSPRREALGARPSGEGGRVRGLSPAKRPRCAVSGSERASGASRRGWAAHPPAFTGEPRIEGVSTGRRSPGGHGQNPSASTTGSTAPPADASSRTTASMSSAPGPSTVLSFSAMVAPLPRRAARTSRPVRAMCLDMERAPCGARFACAARMERAARGRPGSVLLVTEGLTLPMAKAGGLRRGFRSHHLEAHPRSEEHTSELQSPR